MGMDGNMLTYNEFYNQWVNKYCEVSDPTNPNQCFDLAVAWCNYLGIPKTAISHLYAYQIYTQPTEPTYVHFYRIPNLISTLPKQGDMIVWNYTYNGTAGHVGIVHGNILQQTLDVFVQNDPTGKPCLVKNYNYNHILGWLRSIAFTSQCPPATNCQNYIDQVNALSTRINNAKSALG